ncbi:beta-lactamase family protein [Herbidospora galbida]|uniref:Beta-lactamase family protein n=1 Tax=Herbidospora galbida TaxID=2575442 RepID=A0A4U3MGK1_9ACTN|nr:serine hydrolase domain-containing protein [Herbidospora galbida]TKK87602.1 beta-lactamase family protein [Herbidospora galbida]
MLDRLLASAVPEVASAAVALVAVDGVPVAVAAHGELVRYADAAGTLALDRPAVAADSVFDLASLTKLFTTVVAVSLAETGALALDEPVATWLPAHYGDRPSITLRHLLTHTSGLPPGRRPDGVAPESRWDFVLSAGVTGPPGPYVYSDVGLITVGRVCEAASGMSLDRLVDTIIARPLGLADAAYRPGASSLPRIAATEYKPERSGRGTSAPAGRVVRGEVHDETAHALGGVAGHAGLFSTAADLLRFAEILRTGGAGVLSAESVAEMTRDHGVAGASFRQALGFRIGDPAIVGPLADAHGHSGFTGTSLVVDVERGLTVVLLTNNVHPLRGRAGIRDLRNGVAAFGGSLV